jgi:hypothetical protein
MATMTYETCQGHIDPHEAMALVREAVKSGIVSRCAEIHWCDGEYHGRYDPTRLYGGYPSEIVTVCPMWMARRRVARDAEESQLLRMELDLLHGGKESPQGKPYVAPEYSAGDHGNEEW